MNKATELQPGIIYISFLPPRMTVKKIREIFSRYGEIERIFLDPNKDENDGYFKITTNASNQVMKHATKRQHGKQYTEGWVEFKDKRRAKRAAGMLNGSPIELLKRRTPYAGMLWNVKYLSGFKWAHLAEQAAYQRAARDQALRTEVSKVKKETQFYIEKRERDIVRKRCQSSSKSQQHDSWCETKPQIKADTKLNAPPPLHFPPSLPNVKFDENILKSIFS